MTRLARVDMYAVAPLLPGDKVAGRVASKGEHFEFTPTVTTKVHSSDPIAVRAPSQQELSQPSFVDLRGARIGRLSVLGISAGIVSTNGTNWVVRCVCGAYETRKAKFIKSCIAGTNISEDEPMCDACGYTRKLQRGHHNPKKAAAAAQAIMEAAR